MPKLGLFVWFHWIMCVCAIIFRFICSQVWMNGISYENYEVATLVHGQCVALCVCVLYKNKYIIWSALYINIILKFIFIIIINNSQNKCWLSQFERTFTCFCTCVDLFSFFFLISIKMEHAHTCIEISRSISFWSFCCRNGHKIKIHNRLTVMVLMLLEMIVNTVNTGKGHLHFTFTLNGLIAKLCITYCRERERERKCMRVSKKKRARIDNFVSRSKTWLSLSCGFRCFFCSRIIRKIEFIMSDSTMRCTMSEYALFPVSLNSSIFVDKRSTERIKKYQWTLCEGFTINLNIYTWYVGFF